MRTHLLSFAVGAPDSLAHGQLLMGIFIPKKYKQLIRELSNQEPPILFFFFKRRRGVYVSSYCYVLVLSYILLHMCPHICIILPSVLNKMATRRFIVVNKKKRLCFPSEKQRPKTRNVERKVRRLFPVYVSSSTI